MCLGLVDPCRDECGNFVTTVKCERVAASEQLLIIKALCVPVREVVSALQRGRGPAQSHSQVLLPRRARLETLRAHAEVRSRTTDPTTSMQTNIHHLCLCFLSFFFFCCGFVSSSFQSRQTCRSCYFNEVVLFVRAGSCRPRTNHNPPHTDN